MPNALDFVTIPPRCGRVQRQRTPLVAGTTLAPAPSRMWNALDQLPPPKAVKRKATKVHTAMKAPTRLPKKVMAMKAPPMRAKSMKASKGKMKSMKAVKAPKGGHNKLKAKEPEYDLSDPGELAAVYASCADVAVQIVEAARGRDACIARLMDFAAQGDVWLVDSYAGGGTGHIAWASMGGLVPQSSNQIWHQHPNPRCSCIRQTSHVPEGVASGRVRQSSLRHLTVYPQRGSATRL